MQRFALGALVSACALAASPIAAAEAPQRTVDLSGIDLNSDAGADHALRRLQNAANDVCGVRTGIQSNSERRAARLCANEAVADAVDTLGAPRVSSRFERNRNFAALSRGRS